MLRGSCRLSDHLDMSRWSGDVANFLVTIVANLLRVSLRRRQQVRELVTGKLVLVPVEFELYATSLVDLGVAAVMST